MKEYFLKNEIYYRTNEFNQNRLTLVFVHGVSGSSSAWLPYEKIFENKYNILTFDIRGHGKSKKFHNYADYEMKYFANDIHNLVSYLKISKFIIISHSFAAPIVLEYIKLFRQTVLGVVFLSPMINLKKNFLGKIMPYVLILTGVFSLFSFNPKKGGHIDYTKHPNTTDWNIKRNLADMINTTLRIHLFCLRQSSNLAQEGYSLEKIDVPTLIMHGAKDSMVPVKNSVLMSQKIQNSQLIIIPDIDHIIVLNRVKEVSEAIEGFIKNTIINE
ncbi:MAG TPA: alpha/beta fold hydrolase [Candidatus Paceibacterota bacterium]|nr:alpha/beta fold hydrolase [Candidatus Paceibacterota bacterium]